MKTGCVTDTLGRLYKLPAATRQPSCTNHDCTVTTSSYISGNLADWLEDQQMDHVRGARNHLQTQGKIERWHQTLKKRILLENYYLPGDLEQQIDAFVDHYNHRRHYESLKNLTPAGVYFGRGEAILKQQERTKRKTIETGRLLNGKSTA